MAAGQNLEARGYPKEDICQKLLEDFNGLAKSTLYDHAPQEWKRSYTKDESPNSDFGDRPWVKTMLRFPQLAYNDYLLWSKLAEESTSHEDVVDAMDKRLRDTVYTREMERKANEWEAGQKQVRELLDKRQKVEAMELLEMLRRSRGESVRFLAKEFHVSAKRVALLLKQTKETA